MEYKCYHLSSKYKLAHEDDAQVLFESDDLGECAEFVFNEWCETGADIQGEINIACNKLSGCNTIIELTTLKESLPPYVRDSDQFKKAGGIRYKELNPAPASAIQPANNIPPNNPPVQQTLILPIVDTTLQQIEAATTVYLLEGSKSLVVASIGLPSTACTAGMRKARS